MKNKVYVLAALSVFLITCRSTPQSQTTKGGYYEGDGGKGISLAIFAPKTANLDEAQRYIPALVQGELVSNFSTYTAINVMDRENLDNVYAELLSGYYDDNDDAGFDLGHLPATDYVMNGNIIKTTTGYTIQIQITKTADKMTAASYSGSCTFTELDNLAGVRLASLDLLQKMGVIPTERTKTELAGAGIGNHVNAQTALAKGITAQKNGAVVEAMGHYYNAVSFEPSLLEAKNRVSIMSKNVSTGNIGENARNEIAYRNAWKKTLDECDAFFLEHFPFEIIYDSKISQSGGINYYGESIDLKMKIQVKPTDLFNLIQDVQQGLDKTKKRQEWGFELWPFAKSSIEIMGILNNPANYETLSLPESGFEPVGKTEETGMVTPRNPFASYSIINRTVTPYGKKISVNIALINDNEDIISAASAEIFGQAGTITNEYRVESGFSNIVSAISVKPVSNIFTVDFTGVNVNRITDNTIIKILSINGIDAETAGKTGLIQITTGNILTK